MDNLLALRNSISSMIESQESYNYYLFNVDGNYSDEDLFRGEERVKTLRDICNLVESHLDECITECNLLLSALAECAIEQREHHFDALSD